ncbi:hypothetical protein SAMN05661096_03556 [Marivirga sericea]|uniref:Protein SCO1/2 n=1 Tax=Marivirga sericea TaxID=1028 RepID=A0A1X7L5F2_9BACT|nr:hypothetical protein [Marivirga sericea]SMG49078.1 hypothetical protein SAMN05661096_03556 [Marivirga sericea]
MKKTKILILLITLSFPVILYLFLRSYGENEFALPVFFENEDKLYCNDSIVEKSSVIFSDLNQRDSFKIEDVYQVDFKVVHFPNLQDSQIQTIKNELNRVFNTFNDLSLNVLSLIAVGEEETNVNYKSFLAEDRAKTYLYSESHTDWLVNCLFGFPTEEWGSKHPSEETFLVENTLVLLDEDNKIRGYYDGYETKEVDRLILEIRVLLSNK